VLLAKKANPVEHLTGSATSFLEAKLEVRVLALELLDPLGTGARRARRRFEGFHSGLGVDRTPPKGRELVTEVTDELV
jgi:hypothetical protein